MKDRPPVVQRYVYAVTLRLKLPEIAIVGLLPRQGESEYGGGIVCAEEEDELIDIVDSSTAKIRWLLPECDEIGMNDEGLTICFKPVPAEELQIFHNGNWVLLINVVA